MSRGLESAILNIKTKTGKVFEKTSRVVAYERKRRSRVDLTERNLGIMLVDDESLARKLLENRISQIPGVTVTASLPNGLSAQKYMLEHVVDLVITDIRMPFMDGLELAEFVKKFFPECPIIIISGYDEFEYARKAIQFGVKDYLLKPLQFKQVVEAVEKSMAELRQRQRKLLSDRDFSYETLEMQIYQSFQKGVEPQKWIPELRGILRGTAHVMRLEVSSHGKESQQEECSVLYRNLLRYALPGYMVFRLGYRKEQYDFLIMVQQQEFRRSLKALPEYLEQTLEEILRWSEVCTISSAEELASLAEDWQNTVQNGWIELACSYMKAHLGENLSRDEVAAHVYLSSSYFGQLFKQVMGVGYSEYLTGLRISQAKRLLQSNMSVKEVGEAVGIRDTKYFREIFSKTTGYVPSEYRQAMLNGEISADF